MGANNWYYFLHSNSFILSVSYCQKHTKNAKIKSLLNILLNIVIKACTCISGTHENFVREYRCTCIFALPWIKWCNVIGWKVSHGLNFISLHSRSQYNLHKNHTLTRFITDFLLWTCRATSICIGTHVFLKTVNIKPNVK